MASHIVIAGMAKGTGSLGMLQLGIKIGGLFSGRYMLGAAAEVKGCSSPKDLYFTHKMGEAGVSRRVCTKYSTAPMGGACVSRGGCAKYSTISTREAVVSSGVCAKYNITHMGGTCLLTGGCAKYSTIPMGGVAEEAGKVRFGIFWDATEGCRFPEGFSFPDVVRKMQDLIRHKGHFEPISAFIFYGDASDSTLPHSSSVNIEASFEIEIVVEKDLDTKPHWIQNSIVTDMFMFALDNPAPSKILLVSDKDDTYPVLKELKERGYCIIHALSGKQVM